MVSQVSASALLDTAFLFFFFRFKQTPMEYHGPSVFYQTLLTFLIDPTHLMASVANKVRDSQADPIYGE